MSILQLLISILASIALSVVARRPVVKTYSDRTVYMLGTDEKRHAIPDWSTFVSLGYDIDMIKTLTDEEMEKYPIGEPASLIKEPEVLKNPFRDCPCVSEAAYAHSVTNNSTAPSSATQVHRHKYVICFVDNPSSASFLGRYGHKMMNVNHRIVPAWVLGNYSQDYNVYSGQTLIIPEVEGCGVVFNIRPTEEGFDKYACNEYCLPVPVVEIPLPWLDELQLPSASDTAATTTTSTISTASSRPLTCSMTVAELMHDRELLEYVEERGSRTSGGQEQQQQQQQQQQGEHTHKGMGLMLNIIAQRRFEECHEPYLWPSGSVGTADSPKSIPARPVHGVIVWIGSRTRYALMEQQLAILRNQTQNAGDRIIGIVASEDSFGCRLGSCLCYNTNSNHAYFPGMPGTRMNIASAGWSCAQRRHLRALQHTLLLFAPKFMLVVDDDTFVNIRMLQPGGSLDNYIRTELVHNNHVLGEMTMGKKVTKRGFYWGGAGYLFGESLIKELNGYVLSGPPSEGDDARSWQNFADLSVYKQAVESSARACKDCVVSMNDSETSRKLIGAKAKTEVRLIDICSNLMSQEHTCFHSDHAMSRCLLHGAQGYPYAIGCGGTRVGKDNVLVGMCMGTDYCGPEHLTCHRFYPHPQNPFQGKGMYI